MIYLYIYVEVTHKDTSEELKQCLKPSQWCFFFCQRLGPLLRLWICLEVNLEFPEGFICQFRVKRVWDPFFWILLCFLCSIRVLLIAWQFPFFFLEVFFVGLVVFLFVCFWRFFLSYGTVAVCNFPMLQRNQKCEKISV